MSQSKSIRVPMASLDEAMRTARILSELGATIEDDRDIPRSLYLVVCHHGAHRVILEIRRTIASQSEVLHLVKMLNSK